MSRPLGSASSLSVSVPDEAQAEQDLTLVSLLGFALQHRRLILGAGLIAFLVVGVITFVRPRTYT